MTAQKVLVYFFRGHDLTTGDAPISKVMATLGKIEELRGQPLHETAREVDLSELDGNGFFRPSSRP